MEKHDDLADAATYAAVWHRLQKICRESNITFQSPHKSMPASDDWDYYGSWRSLPQKGLIMKSKIKLEFSDLIRAQVFWDLIDEAAGALDISCTRNEKIVDLDLNDDSHRRKKLLHIAQCLNEVDNWVWSGPPCPGSHIIEHTPQNAFMMAVAPRGSTASWSCFQRGCRKHLTSDETEFMSYKQFNLGLHCEDTSTVVPRVVGHYSSEMKDLRYNDLYSGVTTGRMSSTEIQRAFGSKEEVPSLQKEARMAASYHMDPTKFSNKYGITVEKAADLLVAAEKELRTFREASKTVNLGPLNNVRFGEEAMVKSKEYRMQVDALKKEIEELKAEVKPPPTIIKVADEMFRFLAGVNFQDHSRTEQLGIAELMTKLRLALNEVGIGKVG